MKKIGCLFLQAALLPLLSLGAATQDQPLAFEVATIKPSAPPTAFMASQALCHGVDSQVPAFQIPIRVPPQGRCLLTRQSLKALIAFAYYPDYLTTLRDEDRVTGGPAWVSSDLFDVEGKADDVASATQAQLVTMLRQLLIARFKLETHTEQREVSGYALMVEKNGPKMEPGTSESHSISGGLPGHGMSAKNADMALVAWQLARFVVKAPVIDRTGLSGGYNFTLPVTSDINSSGPSIFTALREELGLRLDTTKVPTDVIVIDHAEKHDAN